MGACAVALLLAEALLRVIGYARPPLLIAHETRGFALRPNTRVLWTAEGRSVVEINPAGFRDVEHTAAKPRSTFRIAVLGDSFVEALQVPLDSTFWKRLEQTLGRCTSPGTAVEVLNFGVSGYGTAQQLITYRTVVRAYDPDLVLLAVTTGNDVRDNSRVLTYRNDEADRQRDSNDPRRRRPFFTLDGDSLRPDMRFRGTGGARARLYSVAATLAANSRIVQLAWDVRRKASRRNTTIPVAGMEEGLDVEVYRQPSSREWEDAWRLTGALLGALDREAKGDGARLVVTTLSQGVQVHPDSVVTRSFMQANDIDDIFFPDQQVRALAAERGIPAIMLAPALQAHARRTGAFLHGFANTRMGSGHWNPAGHRIAAAALHAPLCSLIQPAR